MELNLLEKKPYSDLAQRLDELPNGFPSTPDGIELRLLAKLFTPEEATLAAQLKRHAESPAEIALRVGGDPRQLRQQLKAMAKKGLITASPVKGGLGYSLMPFVVGIYEMQGETIDAELAELFEQYYLQAFGQMLAQGPSVHRVIPVNEAIPNTIEVRPYESVSAIIESCFAWGVVDCICRKQKMLVGDPCEHPLDNCMVLSTRPGVFDQSKNVRALSKEEAMLTLRKAADAGLVHSVSNHKRELWYICNCCSCSCGVLRGMADLGITNVVARSAFVSQVDDVLCALCGTCLEHCQFDALRLDTALDIQQTRCVGCGLCVIHCPEGALQMVLRPENEIPIVPLTGEAWMSARAQARGIDLLS